MGLKLVRGKQIFSEAVLREGDNRTGFDIPRPPRWTGRANIPRSVSLGASRPVREGIIVSRIASSRGIISSIRKRSGKKVHLPTNP